MTSLPDRIRDMEKRLDEAERRARSHAARAERLEEEVRLARRIDSLGYMTANVVHDVNNLLTPILCLSNVLARDTAVELRTQEAAQEIELLAQRTAMLLRQLLAFVRRGPERATPVNLNVLLTDMRPLLEILAGRGVQVSVCLEEGLGDVRVPTTRLEQALFNLVGNARDAMPHGGIITVQAFNTEHTVPGVATKQSCVALRVSDTGSGMDPEVAKRVFDEGFTTKHGGTGLGLASVHRMVVEVGGAVALKSRPGEGTSVSLFFPREERVVSQAHVVPPPRPSMSGSILVVDDDEGVRRGARVVLEAAGHLVYESGTGAAVDTARSIDGPLHLLLVDLPHAPAEARGLLGELRGLHPDVAVLYMSGSVSGAPESGPLLRKAFSGDELLRRTREALGARRAGGAGSGDRPASA